MKTGDLTCNVENPQPGKFQNSIIIQHHDLIVTSADLGLNVQCYYDLSNRTVASAVAFDSDG